MQRSRHSDLMDDARRRASNARARAHARMMYGGASESTAPSEDVRNAIDAAIARARQNAQRSEDYGDFEDGQNGGDYEVDDYEVEDYDEDYDEAAYEQEGGDKNLNYLKAQANARIEKLEAIKSTAPSGSTLSNMHIPSVKSVMNSLRSYVASVSDPESTEPLEFVEKRYYHGAPVVAARKALAKAFTISNKTGVGLFNVGEPRLITLIEVTKGIRNSKGGRYVYKYFGRVETLIQPKTVERGDKSIEYNRKYVIVPIRKGVHSVKEAFARAQQFSAAHGTPRAAEARERFAAAATARRGTHYKPYKAILKDIKKESRDIKNVDGTINTTAGATKYGITKDERKQLHSGVDKDLVARKQRKQANMADTRKKYNAPKGRIPRKSSRMAPPLPERS